MSALRCLQGHSEESLTPPGGGGASLPVVWGTAAWVSPLNLINKLMSLIHSTALHKMIEGGATLESCILTYNNLGMVLNVIFCVRGPCDPPHPYQILHRVFEAL